MGWGEDYDHSLAYQYAIDFAIDYLSQDCGDLNKTLDRIKFLKKKKIFTDLALAFKKYPDSFELFFEAGLYYFEIKKIERALTSFSRAVDLNKEHFIARCYVGRCLSLLQKYTEAEKVFENIYFTKEKLDKNKDYLDFLYEYGFCLQNNDKKDNAIKIYKEILSIDEFYPRAVYRLEELTTGEEKEKYSILAGKLPGIAWGELDPGCPVVQAWLRSPERIPLWEFEQKYKDNIMSTQSFDINVETKDSSYKIFFKGSAFSYDSNIHKYVRSELVFDGKKICIKKEHEFVVLYFEIHTSKDIEKVSFICQPFLSSEECRKETKFASFYFRNIDIVSYVLLLNNEFCNDIDFNKVKEKEDDLGIKFDPDDVFSFIEKCVIYLWCDGKVCV